jgi:hypothetical protein
VRSSHVVLDFLVLCIKAKEQEESLFLKSISHSLSPEKKYKAFIETNWKDISNEIISFFT